MAGKLAGARQAACAFLAPRLGLAFGFLQRLWRDCAAMANCRHRTLGIPSPRRLNHLRPLEPPAEYLCRNRRAARRVELLSKARNARDFLVGEPDLSLRRIRVYAPLLGIVDQAREPRPSILEQTVRRAAIPA